MERQIILGDFDTILDEGNVWKIGGFQLPETNKTRYFCIFKEDTNFKAREFNTYKITYNRGNDEVIFYLNGEEVRREKNVPIKFNQFTVALGIMTEKDRTPQGSVSIHGQTVIAPANQFLLAFNNVIYNYKDDKEMSLIALKYGAHLFVYWITILRYRTC